MAASPSSAGTEPRDLRWTRRVAVFSFSCTLGLSLAELYRSSGSKWVLAPAGALAAILLVAPVARFCYRRRLAYRWLVSLAALNLLLVVPELALRVAGFHYLPGIQFGYPRPDHFVELVPHPELFWVLPASEPGVNSLGFRDVEPQVPKPEGVFRILFLGDSCVERGYPGHVAYLLNALAPPGAPQVDSVTLATSGYSSHQGLVLTRSYADELEADLAFVHFGWNDHWLAYGSPDADKVVQPARPLSRIYARLRLWQAATYCVHRLADAKQPAALDEVRVPLEHYRANLESMREIFRERGIPVVFVTAPTAHERLGVPDYLIELNFARDPEAVIDLHGSYNEVVREAGRREGAYLLDLKRELDGLRSLDATFKADGIHFTQPGMRLVGRTVAEFVLATGWLDADVSESVKGRKPARR